MGEGRREWDKVKKAREREKEGGRQRIGGKGDRAGEITDRQHRERDKQQTYRRTDVQMCSQIVKKCGDGQREKEKERGRISEHKRPRDKLTHSQDEKCEEATFPLFVHDNTKSKQKTMKVSAK